MGEMLFGIIGFITFEIATLEKHYLFDTKIA